MATTVLAVILGIILVTVIHPGRPAGTAEGGSEDDIKKVTQDDEGQRNRVFVSKHGIFWASQKRSINT
jgi:Na+/H+-dicarboxylate symporter